MAKIPKVKTTNKELFDTIRDLKKLSNNTGVNVWKAVASKLAAPASQRIIVNLSKIEKYSKDSKEVIIPGKVLSVGILNKKITIVAFSASDSAINKIESSGSKFIKINKYILNKPNNKIKILG